MGPTEGVLLQATIPMAGDSCRAGDSEGVVLLPIAVVFGWGGGGIAGELVVVFFENENPLTELTELFSSF